jgi:hypothetical protein
MLDPQARGDFDISGGYEVLAMGLTIRKQNLGD